jgi:hypothetical protein
VAIPCSNDDEELLPPLDREHTYPNWKTNRNTTTWMNVGITTIIVVYKR